jgi:hypothetical protein
MSRRRFLSVSGSRLQKGEGVGERLRAWSEAQLTGDVRLQRQTSPPRLWNLSPREAAILAAILAVTALIYMPSIRYGWVWDDWDLIVYADPLHSWTAIGKSFVNDLWWFHDPGHAPVSDYYRPLEDGWFALNYILMGDHPSAWHLEKVVVELIAVMLSFRLAQLLTASTAVALLTAAIFAMLPANVESVVWASAIPEPLSAMFQMGALCCLIQRKPAPASGLSREVVFALILYACALLTHETAILFCLIVAAYAFLIERRHAGESMALAAPFMLLAFGYLCARLNALGTSHFLTIPHFQDLSVTLGWQPPAPPRGLLEVILTTPVVLLVYAGVLVVPGLAAPAHDVPWSNGASAITFWSAGALVVLVAIASAAVWRSSHRRLYLFCAAWSLLTFAPAMKLNALATLVEERLLYAPSFGWCLACAFAAFQLAAVGPRARPAVAGTMAIVLAAYAVSIVRMEGYWRDDLTFFTRRAQLVPRNVDYLRIRVTLLNSKGDFTDAMNALRSAVKLDPDDIYLHTQLARQYAMMHRASDFSAEMVTTRALRARARAAATAGAAGDATKAVPTP